MTETAIISKLHEIKNIIVNRYDDPKNEYVGIKYGILGHAVFLSCFDKLMQSRTNLGHVERILGLATDFISEGSFKGRVYEQLVDFTWLIEFINRHKLIDYHIQTTNAFDEVDRFIEGKLKESFQNSDYDVITGALCAGYFYLSRFEYNEHYYADQLKGIVSWLETVAIEDSPSSIYWISSLFPEEKRIYLGISHGSISVLLFLNRCVQLNIAHDKCRSMIKKGVTFVLSKEFRNPDELSCHFPVAIGFPVKRAPLEWCYGDLSIGVGLYKLSTAFSGEMELFLQLKGNEVMLFSSNRKNEKKVVVDASLVHGVSGTATLFREMYKLTRDTRYLKASRYWTEESFKYLRHSNESAGFESYFKFEGMSDLSVNLAFASGIAGIGLNFISYLNEDIDFYKEFLYL